MRLIQLPSPGLQNVGSYVTGMEAFGRTPRFAEITQLLGSVPLDFLITRAAWVGNAFLYAASKDAVSSLQTHMLPLLPEDVQVRVGQLSSTAKHRVLFHRQQQFMMLCQGFMSCHDGDPSLDEGKYLRRFALASLMMNDFAGKSHPIVPADQMSPDDLWRVSCTMTGIQDLFTDSDLRHTAGRAWRLWLELRSSDQMVGCKEYVDIDGPFLAKYGIGIKDFLTAVFFVAARALGFSPEQPPADNDLFFDSGTLMGNSQFPQEKFDAAVKLISHSPDEYVSRMIHEPRQSSHYDFSLLRERPLVRIAPSRFLALDQGFLSKVFTDGVYWLIRDSLEGKGFDLFFGRLVERYVTEVLDGTFRTASGLGAMEFSPRFQDNSEVSDALMVAEETWTLVEVKSSMLPTNAKYADNADTFKTHVTAKFCSESGGGERKGVYQLANNIKKLARRHALKKPELYKLGCKVIYPVLVSYDPSVTSLFVPTILDGELRRLLADGLDGVDDRPFVAALTVMSVEDVELLSAIRRPATINRIIASFHATKRSDDTFNSFLSREYRDRIDMLASPLGTYMKRFINSAGEQFAGLAPFPELG